MVLSAIQYPLQLEPTTGFNRCIYMWIINIYRERTRRERERGWPVPDKTWTRTQKERNKEGWC
ncbi:hypothetical protein Hanom_Chr01g00043811 [Helianthus anomalus]